MSNNNTPIPYGKYVDDVTGLELQGDVVRAGRLEERKGFEEKGVYERRLRSDMRAQGIKIIWTRWIDRLKHGAVRSRLCAQDFSFGKGGTDAELYSPTPPLAAARYLVRRTASDGRVGSTTRRILSLEFKKAFLNGYVKRDVCGELPGEDAGSRGCLYVVFEFDVVFVYLF